MVSITLTHDDINSGSPVVVLAGSITTSYQQNNTSTANANGNDYVEVQTQSFENPKYVINGINYTYNDGTTSSGSNTCFSIEDLRTLMSVKYDGTNYITLNVTYGDSNTLKGRLGSANIQVVLDGNNSFNLSARDITNAKIPMGSLTLVETK